MKSITIFLVIALVFLQDVLSKKPPKCRKGCRRLIDQLRLVQEELEERVSSLESRPVAGGWQLVFSAKSGSGRNVLEAWTGSDPENPNNPDADVHKTTLMDDPKNVLDAVKISVLANGDEKAYFIFNARGASKDNWMTKERLLASSSGTLAGKKFNFFSPKGHDDVSRHFYINERYSGCPGDFGWLVVVDVGKIACPWMERAERPFFLYCLNENSCDSDDMPIGDTFTISAKFLN